MKLTGIQLKAVVTSAALILIALHWATPIPFDSTTWVLVGAALLPWLLPRLSKAVDTVEFAGWKLNLRNLQQIVQHQETKMGDQEEIIRQLVVFSMSPMIYTHLWRIYYGRLRGGEYREYLYRNNPPFQREMYYLRDNGFIQPVGEGYLDFDQSLDGKNLVDTAKPTPIGEFYIKLREEYEGRAQVMVAPPNSR